jgi:hypothetical protein
LANRHVGPIHDVAAKAEVRPSCAKKYGSGVTGLDRLDGSGKLRRHAFADPVLGRIVQRDDSECAIGFQGD